ncbi:MAG: mitochondrial import inner membrane translocase subunit TIM16 [Chrysothrix sp. TS-e1954]|nr:MAG: mitochondrial import inner membrane translocase subunit TIM16 [Chrysothrix sp. TS-e1954]
MAHRLITQVVITGARVFGRAFAEAYRQANASKAYAKTSGSGAGTFGAGSFSSGMSLSEAIKILDIGPTKGAETNLEPALERFKHLFDKNDPNQGGSFYLQSKILRARERIEQEVRDAKDKKAETDEAKKGWKPKVYKDR